VEGGGRGGKGGGWQFVAQVTHMPCPLAVRVENEQEQQTGQTARACCGQGERAQLTLMLMLMLMLMLLAVESVCQGLRRQRERPPRLCALLPLLQMMIA
jgi:hypothetical protein